ncbi:MAG: sulfatase-like hydrolase/transferase [Alphaproteobacteria bacterium]|nr:sulfatase-like hydrolase/transferase [Alphaproteobacteria bacterium]
MVSRRQILKYSGASLVAPTLFSLYHRHADANAALFAGSGKPKNPINIVLVTADDMQWQAFGAETKSGKKITPNLDRWAREGVHFLNSNVQIASCMPCRSSFLSGVYPIHNGSWSFIGVMPGVTTLPELLKHYGYYVGLIGKTKHTLPGRHHIFDAVIPGKMLEMGRSPTAFGNYTRDLISASEKSSSPFFLNINFHDPHTPYPASDEEQSDNLKSYIQWFATETGIKDLLGSARLNYQGTTPGDPLRYDPDDVKVFDFLPDIPVARQEMAQYYTSVNRMDEAFGRVIEEIKKSKNETLVIFFSDHGMAVPFSKQNVYRNSTRASMVVNWTGTKNPGRMDTENFVDAVDVFPTILDVIGAPSLGFFDGRSFKKVLEDPAARHKSETYAYYHANGHATGAYLSFPMRGINDANWGYVFNAWADGKRRLRVHGHSSLTFKSMRELAASDPEIAKRVNFASLRSTEEFYNYAQDAQAMNNLAGKSEHVAMQRTYRAKLLTHMVNTRDPLADIFKQYAMANPI